MAGRRSGTLDIIEQRRRNGSKYRSLRDKGGKGPTERRSRGGSGYAGQVHDGEYPGSGTASWDGAWCSFEHGGVSTLEQSHRLSLIHI